MPVHFTVATHSANQVKNYHPIQRPSDLLKRAWGEKETSMTCGELLQSSLLQNNISSLRPQDNGFVRTVISAYNGHHHLILKPDDIWIAILGQFNFYVNANAEDLRSHFVKHEGKKELIVTAVGTRYTVDFGNLAHQMTEKIHENVIDKSLKDWILPSFSTTTNNDIVICAVLMMSTLKAYFSYVFSLTCGIPSVTLEGEKADWEDLLSRLDKFSSFGREPTAWVKLLRPILHRFVQAFDGRPDIDFWGRVCHHSSGGSGSTYLSGWITAFCVWSSTGKWQGPPLETYESSFETSPPALSRGHSEEMTLILDGALYPVIDSKNIPVEFCEVDVKLDDNGRVFDCLMVSGHMASLMEGTGDTIRPFPSWFMFIPRKVGRKVLDWGKLLDLGQMRKG